MQPTFSLSLSLFLAHRAKLQPEPLKLAQVQPAPKKVARVKQVDLGKPVAHLYARVPVGVVVGGQRVELHGQRVVGGEVEGGAGGPVGAHARQARQRRQAVAAVGGGGRRGRRRRRRRVRARAQVPDAARRRGGLGGGGRGWRGRVSAGGAGGRPFVCVCVSTPLVPPSLCAHRRRLHAAATPLPAGGRPRGGGQALHARVRPQPPASPPAPLPLSHPGRRPLQRRPHRDARGAGERVR